MDAFRKSSMKTISKQQGKDRTTRIFVDICYNHSANSLHILERSRQKSKAARIIAQLIVVGSGMMIRAFAQAYRQALSNASKTGAAQEVAQNIKRAGKAITETEARQVLGVAENSSWEEIMQKYDNLFEQNAKNGSFYLQSKVHRAKECLEAVYQSKSEGTN
nr:mitochondrial import inner membrane translocase subunit tim16-like [Ipomoea batatas]